MAKKLLSGTVVSSALYYQLLDWKDTNMNSYLIWCGDNKIIDSSINNMTLDEFNRLCKYANVK